MSILSLKSVLIGIVATLTMDVLTVAATKLRLIAPLPPKLIGRWFASVARGQALHRDIGQVPPINHELAVAVPAHYAIGVTLTLLYLFANSAFGLNSSSLKTALGFALCTSLLPWLLMFPAMGYGWFGARGREGTRLFPSSLVTHGFYGLGLWFSVSLLS
jgi:hypothetical protein